MFDMPTQELLTTGQIAAELGVNRATVHYWAKTGKLVPEQTVNGTRLFARGEVDRFAEARNIVRGEVQS